MKRTMKIYPNKSKIMVTNNVDMVTDIPLSYVDTEKMEYSISTIVEPEYSVKTKQELQPYDAVNNNIICLFDDYGNLIDPVEAAKNFRRGDEGYIYVPYGSRSFNASRFQYRVIGKRNLSYDSKTRYDIAVSASDSALANMIVPIFGDAPAKGNAPSNILVNSGSSSHGDLITGSYANKDFLFVQLQDPATNALNHKFSIPAVLEYRTNVFASMLYTFANEMNEYTVMDDTKVTMYATEEPVDFQMASPMIYEQVDYSTKCFFSIPKDNQKEKIRYHNLFSENDKTPILIEEHIGKGFVVYAYDNLLENVAKYSKVIYEVMFYVYSKAYMQSSLYEEWIADVMPDSVVIDKKLTKKEKFSSQYKVHEFFDMKNGEVSLYSVDINSKLYPFAKYKGESNSYLVFEKDCSECESYKDPVKAEDEKSIMLDKRTIIFFKKSLYRINDAFNTVMAAERSNNSIKVIIKPYRHSDSGICITTSTELTIPLAYTSDTGERIQVSNANYHIVCKENSSASYFDYVNEDSYKQSDGIILATIQVRQDKAETLLYDMRQRGGGLPEGEKPVYDCFDIGHVFGRPYRKGGTIIVTLPKRLEPHKEMIEQTIAQYCAAEEYPVVIFEEDN